MRILPYRKPDENGNGSVPLALEWKQDDTKDCVTTQLMDSELDAWEEEVTFLKKFSHPNIVRYLGTGRDGPVFSIMLEDVPGGSVAAQLKKAGCLPEETVRRYTEELLQGLEYVHSNCIMHRNIEAANLLLDEEGSVKLAGFGDFHLHSRTENAEENSQPDTPGPIDSRCYLARNPDGTWSPCLRGKFFWMAPEVLEDRGYGSGRKADIWSVGITVRQMLCGYPDSDSPDKEFAVPDAKLGKLPPLPSYVSASARDFISQCLQISPTKRPTAKQLLQHPFIARIGEEARTAPAPSRTSAKASAWSKKKAAMIRAPSLRAFALSLSAFQSLWKRTAKPKTAPSAPPPHKSRSLILLQAAF